MKIFEQKNASTTRLMRLLGMLVIICLCGIAMVPAVAATAASSTSVASDAWSGTWETAGSTPIASQTLGVLSLTRNGSSVTGTFVNNDHGRGTITGTITGNQLAGTWTVNYGSESDFGSLKFVLSDDKKSFTGTWVSIYDTVADLSKSPESWNGIR